MNINYKIGDCREVLKQFSDGSFDACVTDPPYGLEFMGKEWDKLRPDIGRHDLKPSGQRFTPNDPRDSVQGRVARKSPSGFAPKKNPRCQRCGRLMHDHDKFKCKCKEPDFDYRYCEYGFVQQAWHYLWAIEVYRVLKPGGYLLAFGGTRTYHRMVCAVEDAGFEIRDTIAWIYGQGFSKIGTWNEKKAKEGSTKQIRETSRMMVDAGWDGWGGALKPAIDLIVQARKPISEKNVAMNVLAHGVGGINVGGCRVGFAGDDDRRSALTNYRLDHSSQIYGAGDGYHKASNHLSKEVHTQGRFPANIILNCCCEKVIPGEVAEPRVRRCANTPSIYQRGFEGTPKDIPSQGNDTAPIHTDPNCPCYMLDAQSGELKSGDWHGQMTGLWVPEGGGGVKQNRPLFWKGDKGGASRFFYVAKASKRERWFYCSVCNKAYSGDKREAHKKHSMKCLDCDVDYEPQFVPDASGREKIRGGLLPRDHSNLGSRHFSDPHKSHNTKSNLLFHVTQKPEQLIRYLIRLVTPPGGTVLDPFLGSGTTLVAARMEGMNALGIEIGTEYEPLISARVNAIPRSIFSFQETE